MSWIEGSILLFGGLVAVMGLGLPVAFAFLALNVVGAIIFLGGEPGLVQVARNAVQSITSFSLTPIPFFVLMGEVLFHTGVALKAIDAFALLISGTVPGLILAASYVGYIIARATIEPTLAPQEPAADASHGAARWLPFFTHVVPLVLIFGLVIGAMTGGLATPTEAAAIGAAGTIAAAALYRSLTAANLLRALTATVAVSGIILFIIVGATTFAQVLSFSGAVNGLVGVVTGLG